MTKTVNYHRVHRADACGTDNGSIHPLCKMCAHLLGKKDHISLVEFWEAPETDIIECIQCGQATRDQTPKEIIEAKILDLNIEIGTLEEKMEEIKEVKFAVAIMTKKGIIYGPVDVVKAEVAASENGEVVADNYIHSCDAFTRAHEEDEEIAIMMCDIGCKYKLSGITEVK